MSGLPPGWEWDYDGARWFYRYKPNGHIQFHFPKEGDEFPDFIDALSPVPELAPEEKLESQQQLKRRAPVTDDRKSQMRATGGPLADFGMNRSVFGGPGTGKDDEDGDGFFYQPENFMYLGPGAYSDVSPVADEDGDEIPKDRHKNEATGAQGDVKDKTMLDATSDDKTGVSPLQSETNTPSVVNSVLARDVPTVPEPVAEEPRAEPVLIVSTHDLPQPGQPAADSPGVPLLDSVEKPRQEPPPVVHRPSWDPVGIMAEMATEETAAAHIEIHPDPVEMADSSVLAPIETRMIDLGIAELPEPTSPSDARPLVPSTHDLLHRTTMTDADLHGATFGSGSRPQSSSPTNSNHVKPETEVKAVAPKPDVSQPFPQIEAQQPQASTPPLNNTAFAIKRKPSNPVPKQGKYQPYKPGAVPTVATEKQTRDPEFKQREHRNSLAREASLMMGNRQKFETSDMPSILQPPQVPPKHPLDSTQPPSQRPSGLSRSETFPTPERQPMSVAGGAGALGPGHAQGPLQHVPSVLKPARGYPQGRPSDDVAVPPNPNPNPTAFPGPSETAQPSRYSAFQPGVSGKQGAPPGGPQLYAMPQTGHIPHSLTPAPGQHPSMGPRPSVQRFETAPVQPLPGARPPLQEADIQVSPAVQPLPQVHQGPPVQGGGDQGAARYEPFHAAARARSRSDLPKPTNAPAALLAGQQPFAVMPRPEPSPSSKAAPRPQSAMDLMQGHAPSTANRGMQPAEPSPPPDAGLPRHMSFASSEVSSLGPPSGSQSSGVPVQTPSPLESGGRRPSSGFFRSYGPSGNSTTPGVATPGSNGFGETPNRPAAGTRPASYSGTSPTHSQANPIFNIAQGPPAIPGKIPIQPAHDAQTPASIVPGNRAIQNIIGTAQSSASRRHSLPTEQAILSSQPLQSPPPPRTNGAPGPNAPANGVPQPIGMQQPQATFSKGPPPHPHNVGQQMANQPSARPQRPTVTPPSQQDFGPMSPSTPIRTPGHLLQPIQEHHEGDQTRIPVAPRTSQDAQRRSPGSNQQSSASSYYPSSADSPNSKAFGIPGAGGPVHANGPLQQPYVPSPTVATAGQIYSPIHNNPFQSPTGAVTFQPLGRPGLTPPVIQQPGKDKEKGGWLSKLMKGSGNSAVLQKPPPANKAFSVMPQSPHACIPPQGQWPTSPVGPGSNGTQQMNQPPFNPQNPALIWQGGPPMPGMATQPRPMGPETQSLPATPIQNLPQPLGGQNMQPVQRQVPAANQMPQNPPALSFPQAAMKMQGGEPLNGAQFPRQQQSEAPPRGLSPARGPPSDQVPDDFSDAASISAFSVSTMDVSEAQAQPVLKPQLVTVERHASPGQHQLPSRVAAAQAPPAPTKHEVNTRPPVDNGLAVAPLFSKAQAKAQAKATVTAVSVNKPPPGTGDKWAKKPAVDYSGDDWGDDPWDYQ
ncbi:hypothetical protein CSOJ01_04727 [Colletotrichum sojae]|uniref:Uncharacterized protein n=1 Tax=Colletotrichum sojae TaxID=2175907 RepID=A0A8H6JIC8_9PEZI|nr:hypothetical protein CSOJ01_04727 [Colletotrichum sojae]